MFGDFNIPPSHFMYPETLGWPLEEVEEIFNQGQALSAWKIGIDDGKKKLKEVIEKSKDLEVTLLSFNFSTLITYTLTIY